MAGKTKSRKSKKNTKYRRYKNVKSKYQNMVSSRQPFARKFTTKLRYSTDFQLNPGTVGVPAVRVFRLNSLYDPDKTGTGHQPMGFDEIMALYNHFNVIGCRWKITAMNTGQDTAMSTGLNTIGYVVSDEDRATYIQALNWDGISENPEMKTKALFTAQSGKGMQTLTGRINPNAFLGKKKGIMNDDNLRGDSGANPSEGVYLNIFAAPVSSTTDTVTVYCLLELEYIAVFSEPKNLNQS